MIRLPPGPVLVLLGTFAVGCVAGPSGGEGGGVGDKELALVYCAEGETLSGIDVSKWQGEIDWDAVAADGVEFAFIRAAHGVEVVDEWFDVNWRRAREVGILRGAYQYFEGGRDPLEQADLFLSLVGELEPGDLPPVIDVESPRGNPAPAAYVDAVRTWIDRVEEGLGLAPVIYTGKYYWDPNLGGSDEFADYPLWQAWWNQDCPDTPDGWDRWTFWQHTDSGAVAGIAGGVDLDRFDGSREDLLALAAGGVCGDGACTADESTGTCERDCPACQWIGREGGILDESGPCFRTGGDPQFLRREPAGWEESLSWTHTTDHARPLNSGTWSLSLAEAGRYHLEAYTAAPWAQSRQAAYQITHAGVTDVVVVDQSATDGWTSLGEVELAAGHGQRVHLDDNTGESNADGVELVFDALRLTRVDGPVDPRDGGGLDGGPDGGPTGDAGSESDDPGFHDDAGAGGVDGADCGGCATAGPADRSASVLLGLLGLGVLVRRGRRGRRGGRGRVT